MIKETPEGKTNFCVACEHMRFSPNATLNFPHTCGIQDNPKEKKYFGLPREGCDHNFQILSDGSSYCGICEARKLKPQSISTSKWCVKCYPEKEPAEFTLQGNSLCEECFKKILT